MSKEDILMPDSLAGKSYRAAVSLAPGVGRCLRLFVSLTAEPALSLSHYGVLRLLNVAVMGFFFLSLFFFLNYDCCYFHYRVLLFLSNHHPCHGGLLYAFERDDFGGTTI